MVLEYLWDQMVPLSLFVSIPLAVCYIHFYIKKTPKSLPLPPGPTPLPIIGNLHQFRGGKPWEILDEWHQTYGPLMTIRCGQRTVIIIGSHKIAHDLLDKRGAIYSSRPRLVLAFERLARGLTMALMPYSEQWRLHHRVVASLLNQTMAKRYQDLQDIESKQLIHELLTSSDFSGSFLRYATSVPFTLAYGLRLERHDQYEVSEMQYVINCLRDALSRIAVGAVECFPVLDYLPRCLAPWQSFGEQTHKRTIAFFRENLQRGLSIPSWNWAKESSKLTGGMSSDEVAYIIGTILEGGIESTPSILRTILKAIVLHPAVAQKAQKELDHVVGPHRLPSFDDISRLPYIHALVNEAMRWQPFLVLGIPHSPVTDDEYMGFRIPKCAIVLTNNYRMAYDSEICPDPYEFKPERWLETPNLETFSFFGYGRRKCPGRYVAMNSLIMVISRILWGYNVCHSFRDGKKVDIDPWDIKHQFTSSPGPFEVSFQVRSQNHQRIIEQEWEGTDKDANTVLERIRPKRDS